VITDPRTLEGVTFPELPERIELDDGMIIPPMEDGSAVEILYGPNIKPVPVVQPMPDSYTIKVMLTVGDNITTDAIMPAGVTVMALRSNIPEISKHTFEHVDPTFAGRALEETDGSIIVGGINYGQGSSREHAAIAPMYLGVKVVMVKSIARIHSANLINFGIVPFEFVNEDDMAGIEVGDVIEFPDIRAYFEGGAQGKFVAKNVTKGTDIPLTHHLSGRSVELLLAGGLLNSLRQKLAA
jgi:aconitate hydratase